MGAYHGMATIPDEYIQKIRECKVSTKRQPFQARLYYDEDLIASLIDSGVTDDNFVIKKYNI